MKYKIFYIDDLSFALPQLIHAIPKNIDYELSYVQRVGDIIIDNYDLVILDFYLDKDNQTALDIIDLFKGQKILSFSTCSQKNSLMLKKRSDYAIKKLKWTNDNPQLQQLFNQIFLLLNTQKSLQSRS